MSHKYPKPLRAEVAKNLARLEKLTEKKLGDAKDPLLVERAVRLGALDAGDDGDDSQPGPERAESVMGLAKATGNERFAWDAYRRFVQMYSSVVIGLPKDELEDPLA